MAETLSAQVTNFRANTANHVGLAGGRKRVCQGNFEVAAADFDADGDEIHLCVLPGNARVTSIRIGADALDSSSNSVCNVGFSRISAGDPTSTTIVDEDEFASAVTSFRTALRLTEFVDEAQNPANWGDKLWELAGDTSDTGTWFAITITQTATVDDPLAGTIYYEIEYVVD